jgi:hypothetical protein
VIAALTATSACPLVAFLMMLALVTAIVA